MQCFKILILLLICTGCNDNDINTNDGTFSYVITIDGKSYTWSGGVPAPGIDSQCAYTENGNTASITLSKGVNPSFTLAGIIPTGIGNYTIDKNSLNANLGISGLFNSNLLFNYFQNSRLIICLYFN